MGVPPLKVEITTHIDGVDFDRCYSRRVVAEIDGTEVSIVGRSKGWYSWAGKVSGGTHRVVLRSGDGQTHSA